MTPAVVPGEGYLPHRRPRRIWLHVLLFVLTLFTTTAVGSRLSENFTRNRPAMLADDLLAAFTVISEPSSWVLGLPFSLTLLTILLAHEMGHYLTCVHYRIDATLPYFLPAPTLIGTLGAFIWIRSPIYSRRQLFDVGVAGPIAGFVLVIPALGIGLALSKVIPGIALQGDVQFSTPWVLRLLELAVFPGVPSSDIYLHPIARAGWVGLFATALNLLPIGQLDGGHIVYAFVGDWHKPLSRLFVAVLIVLAPLYSWSWLIWALLLFFFGMRHPRIYDETRMDKPRRKLGVVSLAIFVLSFSLSPVTAS